MRTLRLYAAAAACVLLISALSWAKAPKSAIVNSAHDMRSEFNAASFTVCNFCHVAHKTAADTYPSNIGPLLWNHTLSSKTTYGVYSSDTFNALGTDISDLGPLNTGAYTVSNLCLSCHDGTVAINSWYAPVTCANFQPCPQNTTFMPNDTRITDLTNTHPVNFTYNATLANNAGILVPASISSVDGKGEIPLFNGKMQCATCHDPHNGASSIFEQNFPAQSSGSFCTYCHL
jgi:hypothetical protein